MAHRREHRGRRVQNNRSEGGTLPHVRVCPVENFPLPDLGEVAFKVYYSDFLKHCIDIHGLKRNPVSDPFVFLNLEKWTLTLLKWRKPKRDERGDQSAERLLNSLFRRSKFWQPVCQKAFECPHS